MSTKHNEGGPAFPIETTSTPYAPGMTLRDWFAGQAIVAVSLEAFHDSQMTVEQNAETIAAWSFAVADAMLAARAAK